MEMKRTRIYSFVISNNGGRAEPRADTVNGALLATAQRDPKRRLALAQGGALGRLDIDPAAP